MVSVFFVLALLHLPASVKSAGNVGTCDGNGGGCERLTGNEEAFDATTFLQTKAGVGKSALSLEFGGSTSETRDAMLGSIEDMMQSVKNGQNDANVSQLTVIKDMVEDLMPSVTDAHATATALLNEAIERVKACVNETEVGLTKASKTEGEAMDLEDDHKTCRNEEKTKSADMTNKCDALNRFLTDTVYLPIPDPITLEALEPVLNDYSLKADQLQGNKTACNDATESHNTHKSGCDGEQGTFEARFCEYRTELTTLKADSSTCYADAKSSYDEISGNTPGKAAKLQAEMKAFQKILCYLKVWLHSGTVNASIAGQCEDTAIDTSELAINDQGIPDEKLVDDSSVLVYPGSDGWLSKYTDIPHNTFVVHCQGHSHDYDSTTTTTPSITTTEAPTTVAPTTTASPTTAAPTTTAALPTATEAPLPTTTTTEAITYVEVAEQKYCPTTGSDRIAGYDHTQSTSLAWCQSACSQTTECAFMTFDSGNNYCLLSKSCPSADRIDIASGIIYQKQAPTTVAPTTTTTASPTTAAPTTTAASLWSEVESGSYCSNSYTLSESGSSKTLASCAALAVGNSECDQANLHIMIVAAQPTWCLCSKDSCPSTTTGDATWKIYTQAKLSVHYDASLLFGLADGEKVPQVSDTSGDSREPLLSRGPQHVTFQSNGIGGKPALFLPKRIGTTGASLYSSGGSAYPLRTIVMVYQADSEWCASDAGGYLWDFRPDLPAFWGYTQYQRWNEMGQTWSTATRWINGQLNTDSAGSDCSAYFTGKPTVLVVEMPALSEGSHIALFSGNDGSSGNSGDVYFGEFRSYDGLLLDDERARLTCELGCKWDVAILGIPDCACKATTTTTTELPTPAPTTTTAQAAQPTADLSSNVVFFLKDEDDTNDMPDTPADIAKGFHTSNAKFIGNDALAQMQDRIIGMKFCLKGSDHEKCTQASESDWTYTDPSNLIPATMTRSFAKQIFALSGQVPYGNALHTPHGDTNGVGSFAKTDDCDGDTNYDSTKSEISYNFACTRWYYTCNHASGMGGINQFDRGTADDGREAWSVYYSGISMYPQGTPANINDELAWRYNLWESGKSVCNGHTGPWDTFYIEVDLS